MLDIINYIDGSASGKPRGNWQFQARADGGQWEIVGKGRNVTRMRWWARDNSGLLLYSPFSPGPQRPLISPALLAHARAQLASAKG